MAILTSKYFWIVVIIIIMIIVILVVGKKTKTKYLQLTQPKEIVLLPGESATLSENKREDIKTIGSAIYDDIESTSFWTGHDYDGYKSALLLTDYELAFLADYYKTYLSLGKSLYSEMDTQVYTWGSEPAKLQTRLAAIGKR